MSAGLPCLTCIASVVSLPQLQLISAHEPACGGGAVGEGSGYHKVPSLCHGLGMKAGGLAGVDLILQESPLGGATLESCKGLCVIGQTWR